MLWYVVKEIGRFLCVQVLRLAVMGSLGCRGAVAKHVDSCPFIESLTPNS
jgi:hypothetical protein